MIFINLSILVNSYAIPIAIIVCNFKIVENIYVGPLEIFLIFQLALYFKVFQIVIQNYYVIGK
jgi:hypothetical protein